MKKATLPHSVTNLWVNLFALLLGFIAMLFCYKAELASVHLLFIGLLTYSTPIFIYEFLNLKKESLPKPKQAFEWQDLLSKLLGFYVTLAIVLFGYWLFPEYLKPLYFPYWDFITLLALFIMLTAPLYFIYMHLNNPDKDAYWLIGKIVCLDKAQALRKFKQPHFVLTQHFLGWLVKAFFLPIMYVFLFKNLDFLYQTQTTQWQTVPTLFIATITWLYSIDLFVGVIGYLCTFKLFNTHIRSVDTTLFGWVVCVLCYTPFNDAILTHYLDWMKAQTSWIGWIHYKTLTMIWCATALFLLLIYVLSTVVFGVRFSNLTHRGIITNGPYRFTKHPAYVSKNIFWWLTTVPFAYISTQPYMSIKAIFFLSGVSFIYYLRAKTEEAHLSQDPVYVEYALWMNEHGIFAWLGKKLPFLQYRSY
ncbi:MAG: hypothetical protein JSR17_11280 [Proteobacteria bacterium]|nr:hypothetical protein [Pseudomonadota bacterium]